jgi:multidrug efflux pump subunit AcrB
MEKGYTVAQVYMELAAALTDSTTALTMDMSDVTADVVVKTDKTMTYNDLAGYTFEYTNADGDTDSFPLSDIATVEDTVSLTSIRRDNQRRYISVSASIDDGYNVTLVTAKAQKAVAALELPDGVTYEFSGENETIMEAVEQLALMLVLGILLVYFIMVAQFQSLKSPFIVMFTIPLAFTGGFMALLVCGMDVSVISLIGFVMLTGIIVNNGIVLVDCVNQLRAEGLERRAALIEAGVTRLRPILMTSLTTILGLVIMALGLDVGTTMMQPVAVVCIGGLLYATLMTLFVIPCIYDIMNKKALTVITDEDMEFVET